MAIEVKVPTLPRETTSTTVATIYVTEGQWVVADERVMDIETNKVTLEVLTEQVGLVTDILVKEGDTVEAEQVLVQLRAPTKQELHDKPQLTSKSPDGIEPQQQSNLGLVFGVVGAVIAIAILITLL